MTNQHWTQFYNNTRLNLTPLPKLFWQPGSKLMTLWWTCCRWPWPVVGQHASVWSCQSSRLGHGLTFLFTNFHFIWKRVKGREIFHLLVHASKAHNNQGWATCKPRTHSRSSMWEAWIQVPELSIIISGEKTNFCSLSHRPCHVVAQKKNTP